MEENLKLKKDIVVLEKEIQCIHQNQYQGHNQSHLTEGNVTSIGNPLKYLSAGKGTGYSQPEFY